MAEFANGNSKLTLSQLDVAKAIEFWLNEKVLRVPCQVIKLEKSDSPYTTSTFEVVIQEDAYTNE